MNEEIQQNISSAEQQNNKPVKKYVTKGGISATVWSEVKEVEGKTIEFFNVTIQRSYLKKDGNSANSEDWIKTNSFRVEDLPKVALVAEQAYKYVVLKQLGN